MKKRNDWRVLIIGGNSGAGKTYIAQKLAEKYQVSCLMVDDIRIAIQQITTPATHPNLHSFMTYSPKQWNNSEKIVADWKRGGQAMTDPLRAIVEHHVIARDAGKIILEGDGILPEIFAQNIIQVEGQNVPMIKSKNVRCFYLIEDDEDQIMLNLIERGRGFNEGKLESRKAFVRASHLYGKWLISEAEKMSIPIVFSSPADSVLNRSIAAIEREI